MALKLNIYTTYSTPVVREKCCFLSYYIRSCCLQALRSDSAADGQALGETRKQLKEETLLRLVRLRL